ncbi:MAG: hypothetical protein JST89_01410 [Cyanobacteria bacterium SZAS-4]|nr:hypothetical protein [Cyanobacteria bacterium SZAS-4]
MRTRSINSLILLVVLISPLTMAKVSANSPRRWIGLEPKSARPCPQETKEQLLQRAIDACVARDYEKGIALFDKYSFKDHSGTESKAAALAKLLNELDKRTTDKSAKYLEVRKRLQGVLALEFYIHNIIPVFGFPTSDGCTLMIDREPAKSH